ncbi:hypothetical protein, partial [Kitasatospora sp. NPDC002040]|uniref:hypothetical protein n=1 Tax=Kitasatospora sp. NPDC002040 TaxID=3154661 RepID=UPI003331BE34
TELPPREVVPLAVEPHQVMGEAPGGCRAGSVRCGGRLTNCQDHWSTWGVHASRILVTRSHIDFGRVWSAACRRG